MNLGLFYCGGEKKNSYDFAIVRFITGYLTIAQIKFSFARSCSCWASLSNRLTHALGLALTAFCKFHMVILEISATRFNVT